MSERVCARVGELALLTWMSSRGRLRAGGQVAGQPGLVDTASSVWTAGEGLCTMSACQPSPAAAYNICPICRPAVFCAARARPKQTARLLHCPLLNAPPLLTPRQTQTQPYLFLQHAGGGRRWAAEPRLRPPSQRDHDTRMVRMGEASARLPRSVLKATTRSCYHIVLVARRMNHPSCQHH